MASTFIMEGTLSSPTSSGEVEELMDSLEGVMEQTGAKHQGWKLDIDAKLCGQEVFVKVPTVESSEASSTLRQLLLREINREMKTLRGDEDDDGSPQRIKDC